MAAKHKDGLKAQKVTKGHFSAVVPNNSTGIGITLFEADRLIASDTDTGKSDPVCFVWLGYPGITPNFEDFSNPESNIQLSNTCPETVDPKWNQTLTFPIEITDMSAITDLRCIIRVRDEDIEHDAEGNEIFSYDELGFIEFDFKTVSLRAIKNTIVSNPEWYKLQSLPSMSNKCKNILKKEGRVKLQLKITIQENDVKHLLQSDGNPNDPNVINSVEKLVKKMLELINPANVKESLSKSSSQSLDGSKAGSRRPSSAGSVRGGKNGTSSRNTSPSPIRRSLDSTSSLQSIAEGSHNAPLRPHTAPGHLISPIAENENYDWEVDGIPKWKENPNVELSETDQILKQFSVMEQKIRSANEAVDDNHLLQEHEEEADPLLVHELQHEFGLGVVGGEGEREGLEDSGAVNLVTEPEDAEMEPELLTVGKVAATVEKVPLQQPPSKDIVPLPATTAATTAAEVVPIQQPSLSSKDVVPMATATPTTAATSTKGPLSASNSSQKFDFVVMSGDGGFDEEAEQEVQAATPAAPAAPAAPVDPIAVAAPKPQAVSTKLNNKPNNSSNSNSNSRKPSIESIPQQQEQQKQQQQVKASRPSTAGSRPTSSSGSRRPSNASNIAGQTTIDEDNYQKQLAQGNASSAIKALRELNWQRNNITSILEELTKITKQGMRQLAHRMEEIESQISQQHELVTKLPTQQSQSQLFDFPLGGGDTALPTFDGETDPNSVAYNNSNTNSNTNNNNINGNSKANRSATAKQSTGKGKAKQPSAIAEYRKQRQQELAQAAADGPTGGAGGIQMMLKLPGGEIKTSKIADLPTLPAVHPDLPLPAGVSRKDLTMDDDNSNIFGNSPVKETVPKQWQTLSGSPVASATNHSLEQLKKSKKRGIDWSIIEFYVEQNDLNVAIQQVLDMGTYDDLNRLLTMSGPKVEVLSASMRNRLFEGISLMLKQQLHVERCLIWCLALIRGPQELCNSLSNHVASELMTALEATSSTDSSKRGLLAALLRGRLSRTVAVY